jgi:predicted RNase H-like HicB family nuclease
MSKAKEYLMPTRRFKVLVERDREAGAWVTYVPALGHLSTFGQTRAEALENTREAILGYLEAAAKEGLVVPEGEPEAEIVDLEIAIA